jgi:hypothetical protein
VAPFSTPHVFVLLRYIHLESETRLATGIRSVPGRARGGLILGFQSQLPH